MLGTLYRFGLFGLLAASSILVATAKVAVAQPAEAKKQPAASAATESPGRPSELEAKFSKSLSGATLEGSFTLSGSADNGKPLHREKYTLGEVKKLSGEIWLFPARIEYGGKDVTLPIPLPVRWAGDTPVIVVDNVALPGFGAVSARVLFFDGHYSGYWKHGDHSGNLFGEIHSAVEKKKDEKASGEKKESSGAQGSDSSAQKQP